MRLLYGKPIANKILDRLKNDIFSCEKKPGLAVILIGKNEASELYVSLKKKKSHEIGMNFFQFNLSENVSEDEVLRLIKKLNNDGEVDGIIVQLPLPEGLNTEKIISSIDIQKDVDGFLKNNSNLPPVFPRAIILLMESSGEFLKGKKAVVATNSDEFGEKMISMLKQKEISAEYFVSNDIQKNIKKINQADVVISAVGSPGFLRGEILKDGAIVVDGGIEKVEGKIFGDVDFDSIKEKDIFLTPVPGGVGPVTIACLLENVYLAFKFQKNKINKPKA